MNFGLKIRIPSLSRKISAKTSLKRNLGIRKPTLLVDPQKAMKRKISDATTIKLGYKKTKGSDNKDYYFFNETGDENNPIWKRTSEWSFNNGIEKELKNMVKCPKCYSINIGNIYPLIIALFVVSFFWFVSSPSAFPFILLLISIPLFFINKKICKDCYSRFK
jgi:hypothetical protein